MITLAMITEPTVISKIAYSIIHKILLDVFLLHIVSVSQVVL